MLLIPYATSINGIQVYENITDDITTSTTKLVIVPTPIVKSDAANNDSVAASNLNLMEQNKPSTMNLSSVSTTQEKSSRKKESGSIEDRRK